MDLELFIQKVDDGTLTVGEAFEFVKTNPKSTTGQKKAARTLKDNLPFSMNEPYFEVYKTDKFIDAVQGTDFDKKIYTKQKNSNRFAGFSNFESGLKSGLIRTETFKDGSYSILSRAGGVAATKTAGAGIQDRTLTPMNGTIYSVDLDEMYHRHLQNNSYVELNKNGEPVISKKGVPKKIYISQDTKDYMQYEKVTGQRLESNVGKDGLKISDVTITTRPDGSVIAEVAQKKSANKTRPRIKYEGEFALFLKHKVEQATQRAGKLGSDLKTTDLFDTTPDKVNGVWNHFFRPEIESRFSSQLPDGEKATPKVIRKILARILEDEFQVDEGLVDSWIGHSGGEQKKRLSTQAYAGVVSDKRIGPLINNLVRNDAFNIGTSVNDLFIERGTNVPEFKDGAFTYPANTEVYDYTKKDAVVPVKIRRTKQEIETANQLSKTKQRRSRLEELEFDEKITSQEIINNKKALELSDQDPAITKKIADAKAQTKVIQNQADIDAGLKSPPTKKAKDGINLKDVFDSETWDSMTKGLKTLVVATGVAGIVTEAKADYDKYREKGSSPFGAALGAGAETARDVAVDVVTGMNPIKIAADFSLQSSPAGDTPNTTGYRDPKMERQMAEAGAMDVIANDTNLANQNIEPLNLSEKTENEAKPMNYAMDQQMSDMLRKKAPEAQGIM